MTMEEKYRRWKQQRAEIEVGEDFADKVMDRIRAHELQQKSPVSIFSHIMTWVSVHPAAQAAAVILTMAFAIAEGTLLLRIGIG